MYKMMFYEQLQHETENGRQYLLSSPLIQRCMQAKMTKGEYIAFLTEAYHHVKHTVPLLMATGSSLPAEKEWLREALVEYIEEELGHQKWVLNDISACGGDKELVQLGMPNEATELMIAFAYDTIHRNNPVGFFGMIFVLEGTSVDLASQAADITQKSLKLPDGGFTYLRSHGSLDQDHLIFFEQLMNKIEVYEDQQAIIRCARQFYKLYAGIFRSLTEDSFDQAA